MQAFQHDPELVILDEPTSGLDPLVQDEFQRLLRDQAAAGRSVFLSSHSLDEVQHVADRVGIVREGRLVTLETVESLRQRGLRRVTATLAVGQGAERRRTASPPLVRGHRPPRRRRRRDLRRRRLVRRRGARPWPRSRSPTC